MQKHTSIARVLVFLAVAIYYATANPVVRRGLVTISSIFNSGQACINCLSNSGGNNPVCGTDGKTYNNPNCLICKPNVAKACNGACPCNESFGTGGSSGPTQPTSNTRTTNPAPTTPPSSGGTGPILPPSGGGTGPISPSSGGGTGHISPTNTKSNWVDLYYSKVPHTFSGPIPAFPFPPPYSYAPMPACGNYRYKDVLNNLTAFNPSLGVDSVNNIYMALLLSESVYRLNLSSADMPLWWSCLGARKIELIDTQKNNEAAILVTDNAVIVLVQGSNGEVPLFNTDWLSNLKILFADAPSYLGMPGAHIHAGFLESSWDLLQNGYLENKVLYHCGRRFPQNCTILIAGHSRGAAISPLLAAHFHRLSASKKVFVGGVFSFESPKVGDEAFQTYYSSSGLTFRTARGLYKDDGAVGFPPDATGFRHVGRPFVVERCSFQPPGNRIYLNMRHHFPSVSVNALWEKCAGLAKTLLPPPTYPDGSFGLYVNENIASVAKEAGEAIVDTAKSAVNEAGGLLNKVIGWLF